MREIVSVRHRTQERAMSEHVQLRYGVLRRRSDVGVEIGLIAKPKRLIC
jgi:hypothetical protein